MSKAYGNIVHSRYRIALHSRKVDHNTNKPSSTYEGLRMNDTLYSDMSMAGFLRHHIPPSFTDDLMDIRTAARELRKWIRSSRELQIMQLCNFDLTNFVQEDEMFDPQSVFSMMDVYSRRAMVTALLTFRVACQQSRFAATSELAGLSSPDPDDYNALFKKNHNKVTAPEYQNFLGQVAKHGLYWLEEEIRRALRNARKHE